MRGFRRLGEKLFSAGLARRSGLGSRMTGGGDSPVSYLLYDIFTTADSAPVASPRNCEPGPGVMVSVQNDGQFSITPGVLNLPAQTTPATTDLFARFQPSAGVTGWARSTGLMIEFDIKGNSSLSNLVYPGAGWYSADTPSTLAQAGVAMPGATWPRASYLDSLNYYALGVASQWLVNTYYKYRIILRSRGCFAVFENYLVGLHYRANLTDTPLRAIVPNWQTLGSVRSVKIRQLTGGWATDFGIATEYSATASAGAVLNHSANGHVSCIRTLGSGETFELSFRYVDDDNRLIFRVVQGTSAAKLIKREGGIETDLDSFAITVSAASHVITVSFSNQEVFTFIDDLECDSVYNANFQTTATKAKVSHDVSSFATYPQVLSGAVLTELEK